MNNRTEDIDKQIGTVQRAFVRTNDRISSLVNCMPLCVDEHRDNVAQIQGLRARLAGLSAELDRLWEERESTPTQSVEEKEEKKDDDETATYKGRTVRLVKPFTDPSFCCAQTMYEESGCCIEDQHGECVPVNIITPEDIQRVSDEGELITGLTLDGREDIAEQLVKKAIDLWEDLQALEFYLSEAIWWAEKGDLQSCVIALRGASSVESKHGPDDTTQGIADELLEWVNGYDEEIDKLINELISSGYFDSSVDGKVILNLAIELPEVLQEKDDVYVTHSATAISLISIIRCYRDAPIHTWVTIDDAGETRIEALRALRDAITARKKK